MIDRWIDWIFAAQQFLRSKIVPMYCGWGMSIVFSVMLMQLGVSEFTSFPVGALFGIFIYAILSDQGEAYKRKAHSSYIYLLRREDGIYKVGHTKGIEQRIYEHERDYGMGFSLVKSWGVERGHMAERVALDLTKSFAYHEGSRKELRDMSLLQVALFVIRFSRSVGSQNESHS